MHCGEAAIDLPLCCSSPHEPAPRRRTLHAAL
jgi:hypothetical protein